MADRAFTTLAEGGGFFEGPRWHDGRWWVSDFYERTVSAIEPGGGREVVLTVEGQPSGLGWRPDGSLLVNSMKDRRVLRRAGDGTVEEVADLSGVAAVGGYLNDMVITPDGSTLVVGETTGGRLTAFTVADGGALIDRRVWAEVPGTSPDGCTLDAEGRIWAADALGNRLVRVAEGGEIVDEVPAPEGLGFYACMLGGDDGRT